VNTPAHPPLEPGRVYRTRDLARWSTNPPRLAKRLVREGVLVPMVHGLFACPERGRFGVIPPSDEELMRAFLDGSPFVFTGSDRWNALGLGTTAVFATRLVYNTKRSGLFDFGGRRFLLRRVAFPESPPVEWFVIDLFEHAEQAAAAPAALAAALTTALAQGKFDNERLAAMAQRFGSRPTQKFVNDALEARDALHP
jgi:hypothetical protein